MPARAKGACGALACMAGAHAWRHCALRRVAGARKASRPHRGGRGAAAGPWPLAPRRPPPANSMRPDGGGGGAPRAIRERPWHATTPAGRDFEAVNDTLRRMDGPGGQGRHQDNGGDRALRASRPCHVPAAAARTAYVRPGGVAGTPGGSWRRARAPHTRAQKGGRRPGAGRPACLPPCAAALPRRHSALPQGRGGGGARRPPPQPPPPLFARPRLCMARMAPFWRRAFSWPRPHLRHVWPPATPGRPSLPPFCRDCCRPRPHLRHVWPPATPGRPSLPLFCRDCRHPPLAACHAARNSRPPLPPPFLRRLPPPTCGRSRRPQLPPASPSTLFARPWPL